MNWTSRQICWACWRKMSGEAVPTRLSSPDKEPCAYCRELTDSGIYVRVWGLESDRPRVIA
jgi:hypothetical protein